MVMPEVDNGNRVGYGLDFLLWNIDINFTIIQLLHTEMTKEVAYNRRPTLVL